MLGSAANPCSRLAGDSVIRRVQSVEHTVAMETSRLKNTLKGRVWEERIESRYSAEPIRVYEILLISRNIGPAKNDFGTYLEL